MLLGYNTNGFAHHRLEDAIEILAEIGYRSIAITLDYHTLNPYDPQLNREVVAARRLLRRCGLSSVVETGARFLLDARRKHQPTLLSADPTDRARRVDFLCRAVDVASALGADVVSFWSGTPGNEAAEATLWQRLVAGCWAVLDHAAARQVSLAFEPEPGMFVDRMARFARLARECNHPRFGLTLDIGHVHCLDDGPIPDVIDSWQAKLLNVHIEDMRRGVHDHLMFGEGEIGFGPVLAKLDAVGYAGGVHVELSRHSHDAVAVAQRAFGFLQRFRSSERAPEISNQG
jgi:sugar phosphate isomerase/epimerase